jgi:peptidyl-tRNA hydrolase
LDEINDPIGVIGAIVQDAGELEVGPGRFQCFIAVGPIGGEAMVAVGID